MREFKRNMGTQYVLAKQTRTVDFLLPSSNQEVVVSSIP